ncbi:MAG: amidohydrolase family protein [Lysobacterales bacterium]
MSALRSPTAPPMGFLSRVAAAFILIGAISAQAAIEPAPQRTEGEGPFSQLILRGVTLVDGTGAPPIGPVDVVIEDNRITRIDSVGYPGLPINDADRPEPADNAKVLDLEGHFVLPGLIDMHGHMGGEAQGVNAEYVFKLWMGHGITTIRDPSCGNGLSWCLDHRERSAENTIAAPRIEVYPFFGAGADGPISTPAQARSWVRRIKRQGAQGIKFFGAAPKVMAAALAEARDQGLRTAMHHAQLAVTRVNVLDSARLGLTTMEHWYGLPEALFDQRVVQDYPLDYNYNDESHRFGQAGRLWLQAAGPGSERWNSVRDELINLDFTLDPTFTIYEASRDLMRERTAEWHAEYTHPNLWAFFQPSRAAHGSYWFDWTTSDEIAWKTNFQRWMTFVNDYKNHGGRVTAGSDSGYIFKTYGFGYVRELELLQEAGFHPLEVVRAATLSGAQALGLDSDIGSVEVGKLADLIVVKENPIANLKVLYGTGHFKLGEDNLPTRVGGVRYTIKDGIVFDAKKMLADVRKIVSEARKDNSSQSSPAP